MGILSTVLLCKEAIPISQNKTAAQRQLSETQTVTKQQLIDDLRRIGLAAGDAVYVHSSLKRVGWIEGGADALIDAFLEVLTDAGTLAVPTHTLCFENICKGAYDPLCSKTMLGAFPEAVRMREDAYRSAHASHSSAAIGQIARTLTQHHDPTHALGYDSPLHRLYRHGGKVLLLGVTHKANTSIHLAESLAQMPYLKTHYDASWGTGVLAKNSDGSISRYEQVEFPGCSGRFDLLDGFFAYDDIVRYGMIGSAPSQLLDMGRMVDRTVELLKGKPDFLLCASPKCPCCPDRHAIMDQL